MTYEQLATLINKTLTEEQRQQIVTIHALNDEFYPIIQVAYADKTDVLDLGHPFLVIQGEEIAN